MLERIKQFFRRLLCKHNWQRLCYHCNVLGDSHGNWEFCDKCSTERSIL